MGFAVRLVRLVIAGCGCWWWWLELVSLVLGLALAAAVVVVEKKILGLSLSLSLSLVLVLSVAARKWNSWMLGGVRGWFRMWEMRGEEQREKRTQCSLDKGAASPCRLRCCWLVVGEERVGGVGAHERPVAGYSSV